MITFDFERIQPLCESFGTELTPEIKERLSLYGNLLVEWNEKINLTAITQPDDIVWKHFFDCLLLFKHVPFEENAKVIDVGTGAGFPGMILKIVRPDLQLTLLDGLNKRLIFLNEVLKNLGLSAETVHLRAEEAAKSQTFREKFDVATARAVAALPVLCELCLPFVKKNGCFVAMKGQNGQTEAQDARKAILCLGGKAPQILCDELHENEQRTLILIKKISQTPLKYPRAGAKITKNPL